MTHKRFVSQILQQVKKDQGINPKDIEKFLDLKVVSTISQLDKVVPVLLFFAYLAALSVQNYYGDKLSPIGTVPPMLHAFLQSIHDVSGKTADAPTWRAHII